jgi:hypothetical protein
MLAVMAIVGVVISNSYSILKNLVKKRGQPVPLFSA